MIFTLEGEHSFSGMVFGTLDTIPGEIDPKCVEKMYGVLNGALGVRK